MDKSIKKYLSKIIKESITSDMDEMAKYTNYEDPKRAKSLDPVSGKEMKVGVRAYPKDNENPNFIPDTKNKEFIADYYILNPTLKIDTLKDENGNETLNEKGKTILYVSNEGEELLVIPTTCADENTFNEQNGEWVVELEEKYGLKIFLDFCKKMPVDKPRHNRFIPQIGTNVEKGGGMSLGTGYKGPQTSLDVTTKNKIKLFKIFQKEINESGLNDTLYLQNIPVISWEQPYRDTHGDSWTNEKIRFQSHNNNGYTDAFVFLNSILDGFEEKDNRVINFNDGTKRIHPDREGVMTFYSNRQYNKVYKNNPEDRKMDVEYQGKTPIRRADVRGYEEQNLDVSVRSDFRVTGQMIGDNSFTWSVRLDVKLGKKLPEEKRMKGGFENIELIQTTKTAQITPGKDFSKDGIMSDNDVVTALIEALYDLKTKIDSITVGDMLPYADINYSQTTTMNESVERLIRRMVKQIKQ
jgi:hypothetical protein